MTVPLPHPLDRPLADGQGRRITYLRLSLTDRCNFRCSYCATASPERRGEPLPLPHLARLASIFAGLGVRRIRLTGGEPTLRRDLIEIVEEVSHTPGIEEVALTTNGQALAELAAPLRAAGVRRLNVSLDTLRPATLARLAGGAASLERIRRGIEAAAAVGFDGLKLNTVVVRGENDGELGDLARFAWRVGATARFIELMPFGPGVPVPVAEVRRLLEAQGVRLAPDATRGWGPATHMRGASTVGGEAVGGLVGFIGALTENFCDGCNRIRVAADGALRPCLGGREGLPLRALLDAGATDREISAAIVGALAAKRPGHRMVEEAGQLPSMIGTGG